jgi:hypothetical protein
MPSPRASRKTFSVARHLRKKNYFGLNYRLILICITINRIRCNPAVRQETPLGVQMLCDTMSLWRSHSTTIPVDRKDSVFSIKKQYYIWTQIAIIISQKV